MIHDDSPVGEYSTCGSVEVAMAPARAEPIASAETLVLRPWCKCLMHKGLMVWRSYGEKKGSNMQ